MAWQLIYTSAPRLLEAGRSGFGTVARHRQISPLLVSTIERASQFARLPGLDSGRVIYCHRIVAVAGGRFHVLSSIRDAGADYTGRTNHIAHHLIAEPREVAALGARGASPADVLLAMRWATAWDEPPRFLETADEIALATFAPQTGAHWTKATGDANNAWLLVNGEASRGAYLLNGSGTDLRGLFAASLRLSPDRLWQVPFTTALQPSDEASDFRWIGLEADSTLRAQAESSGRPVLDLTRPDTLPAPEVPANAMTIGIPRPSAVTSAPQPRTPAAVRVPPQPRKAIPLPAAPARSHRMWFIGAGAIALLLALSFAVIRPRVTERENIRAWQESLAKKIADWRVFSPQAADFVSHLSTEKLSPADQVLDEIGKTVAALKPVSFEKMRACKTGGEIQQMGASYGIEVPAELTAFANTVRTLQTLNADVSKPPAPERAGFETLQKQRTEIDAFAKEMQATNIFSDAVKELRANHERAEAAALLALLHPRGSAGERLPPEESALVGQRIARGKPADPAAAKIFSEAEKLMAEWKSVQATPTDRVAEELNTRIKNAQNLWPEWLLKVARDTFAKSRGDAPAAAAPAKPVKPAATVPFSIFNSVAAVEDARFPELEKGLTYFFRASLAAAPVELKDPTGQGNLRRVLADPPLFGVDDAGKKISPKPAAENLTRPFALLAKNAAGKSVLEIWVVDKSEKPLLPKRTAGISRPASGTALVLDAAELGLPGVPASAMTLQLPLDCSLTGKPESLPVTNGSANLSALLAQIEKLKRAKESGVKTAGSALPPTQESDVAARFAELKKAVYDAVTNEIADWANTEHARLPKSDRDEKKLHAQHKRIDDDMDLRLLKRDEDFGKDSDPPYRKAGGCILALARNAKFQGHDALYNAGAKLAGPPEPVPDLKGQFTAWTDAARLAEDAKHSLKGTYETTRYEGVLTTLKSIVELLAPETARSKVARQNQEKQLAGQQQVLERIATHPLLLGRVPPGLYRLSAVAEGGDIPLVEIEISR